MSNENRLDNIKRFYILYLFFILILIIICLSETVSFANPDIFVLHSPIQPLSTTSNDSVTFTAIAYDLDGISSIAISVEVRKLEECNGQKCSTPIFSKDFEPCVFDPPLEKATCVVTFSPYSESLLIDGYHIEYRALATNSSGENSIEGNISFFAGNNYPWPNDPIPIYLRGDQEDKIDLVFIPDMDYGDTTNDDAKKNRFLNDITNLIKEVFFSEKPFARHIYNHREMWNFYITYQRGDAEDCNLTPPPNWENLALVVDSGFIVHIDNFRDCSGRGKGSLFSAEHILEGEEHERSLIVPVHEMGHSIFSLADEYAGGGQFLSILPEHNVFDSKSVCENNALNHGWDPHDCRRFAESRSGSLRKKWYRSDVNSDIDGDGIDIMESISNTKSNIFGASDKGRAEWKYIQCTQSNC